MDLMLLWLGIAVIALWKGWNAMGSAADRVERAEWAGRDRDGTTR